MWSLQVTVAGCVGLLICLFELKYFPGFQKVQFQFVDAENGNLHSRWQCELFSWEVVADKLLSKSEIIR